MNLGQIKQINNDRVRQTSNIGLTKIEICKIEDVDIVTMTASVQLVESSRVLVNVPFCLPARYFDRGILYIPEKGALAILGTTYKQESIIIGFLSYSTSKDIGEDLSPGEILIQSKGYSFIKEDNAGNVIIGSPSGNFIVVGSGEDISKFSTTERVQTISKELVSGIVNGVVAEIEKIYDKDISSELSVDTMVQNILNNQNISITKPTPTVIIEKGNVLDEEGNKLKLAIEANPANDAEMAYRITIKDEVNNDKFSFIVDKAGRAKMTGSKLILDFDTFDYSACNTVINNA